MGTGGAVAYAVQQFNLSGSFLLTNADTWLGRGVYEISQVAAPAIAIVRVSDSSRYGQLEINDQGDITAFLEKKSSNAGPGWINTGLCHLDAHFFKNWNQKPFSLEQVSFPFLASTGALRSAPLHTDFIDIGIPEDYCKFCAYTLNNKAN